MKLKLTTGLVAGAAVVASAAFAFAQADSAAEAAVVNLAPEQVARGRSASGQECSECHGVTLRGALGPPLRDAVFLETWSGRPADRLFDFISTEMPTAAPGTLEPEMYMDILAFILSFNGFEVVEGAEELEPDQLGEITIP